MTTAGLRRLAIGALAAVAVTLAAESSARAQQTLFNDPSADVLGHGQGYLEVDTLFRRLPGDGRTHFEGVTPRLIWGPGYGLELGINVGPFAAAHADPYMVPNLKLRLFEGSGALGTFTGVIGTRVYLPFRRSHDILADGYGLLAWRIGPLRLTGGGYLDYDGKDWGPGWLAYAEVTVVRPLRLVAEWWQHRDLGLGVIVALGSEIDLYAAYLLSPGGRDSDGFVLEIGFGF